MTDGSAVGDGRYVAGLERLSAMARELLSETSLEVLLQRIADHAKALTEAAFSAVLILRDGSDTEIQHFFYNAPRDRFPARLPRAVGLLAVPIRTGVAARIDDIRDHEAAVGIPVSHPPVGPLLAVPVVIRGVVTGEVAVANTPDGRSFDRLDEVLLGEFAAHAATAVSLAAAQQAQERAEELRAVIRDVALHNLRTPLSVAEGSVELLREHADKLGPDEQTRLFTSIETAHRRIRELAEGALAEEGAGDIVGPDPARASDPVDPRALLDRLLTDLRDAGPVHLVGVIEDDVPGRFAGHQRSIREALENLLTNAIKASPPGGTVTVTARRESEAVRFDVTDEGPGISPDEQARLFASARARRTAAEPGGQGLRLVRRLVEGRGGALGVSSRPGEGSTFWVTFPLQPA